MTKDKPIVLFFGTSKRYPTRGGKPGKPTNQAKKSEKLASAFNDKKFNVQIALKFCEYYEIDVSKIEKKDSPYICHEKAPMIVVCYNGEVVKDMKIGSSQLIYSTIAKALDQCDIDVYKLSREVTKPINGLYNTEKKIYDFNQDFNELLREQKTNKRKALAMKIDRLKEEKQELNEEKNKYVSEMNEVIAKFTK